MTDTKHIVFTNERYMYTDDNDVDHYTEGQPVYCGDWYNGGKEYCEEHLAVMEKRYPQGWDYYPGDKCKHGVYVGGSGIDWMCHQCEME